MAAPGKNFYLILELDPSVDDFETIRARIAEKKRKWSTDQTSGPLESQRKARMYFDLIPKMEQELADPARRRAIAREAQELTERERREVLTDLDHAIELMRETGPFTAERRNELYTRYEKRLGRKEIDARVKAAGLSETPDQPAKPAAARPRLDETVIRGIEQNAATIGHETLYDFLGLGPQSSCAVLCSRADKIYTEAYDRPVSADKDARMALVAAAKTVFRNDTEKEKYDNTLALRRMDAMRVHIDSVGRDNRFINDAALNSLIKIARQKGVDPDDARAYILEYAANKKWRVQEGPPPPRLPICPTCREVADSVRDRVCTACGTPLFIKCPVCGTENAAEDRYCANEECRINIGDAPLAQTLLAEVRRFHSTHRYKDAIDRFDEALQVWPSWREAADGRAQSTGRQQARDQALAELNRLLDERRSVSARRQLETFEGEFGSEDLEPVRSRIAQSVRLADGEFRRAQTLTQQGQTEEAYQALEASLLHCADHTQALAAMAQIPPPPSHRPVRSDGRRWRPSALDRRGDPGEPHLSRRTPPPAGGRGRGPVAGDR